MIIVRTFIEITVKLVLAVFASIIIIVIIVVIVIIIIIIGFAYSCKK